MVKSSFFDVKTYEKLTFFIIFDVKTYEKLTFFIIFLDWHVIMLNHAEG